MFGSKRELEEAERRAKRFMDLYQHYYDLVINAQNRIEKAGISVDKFLLPNVNFEDCPQFDNDGSTLLLAIDRLCTNHWMIVARSTELAVANNGAIRELRASQAQQQKLHSNIADLEGKLNSIQADLTRHQQMLQELSIEKQRKEQVDFQSLSNAEILKQVRARIDSSTTDTEGVGRQWPFEYIVELVDAFLAKHPEDIERLVRSHHVSEERRRINQYDDIIQLYSQKIARLRAQDMDEEDKEEAIQAMKRLRDREIELLANAENAHG